MNNVITNISGTLNDQFLIGDINLISSSGSLLITHSSGSLASIQIAHIKQQSSLNSGITFLNLKSFLPLIEFDFHGDFPPSPGSNLNKFGICHTSGSFFNEKTVVYDNEVSLIEIFPELIRGIVTTTRVSGSINLEPDSIYIKVGDNYELKGGANKGGISIISIPYTYQDTVIQSSSSINIKYITRIINSVEEPFDNINANIRLMFNDQELISSDPYDLSNTAQYLYDNLFNINNSGYFTLIVNSSGSIFGSGSLYIQYSSS